MTDAAPETPAPGTPDPGVPGRGAAPASLLDQVKSLAGELPGLVSDRVELLALEVQRAAQALMQVVALVVVIAILGVTVWLAMWVALINVLMHAGMPLLGALLLAIALNGIVIVVALARVRGLLPRLGLPATRRHLTVSPNPSPLSENDPENRPDERSVAPLASQPAAQ